MLKYDQQLEFDDFRRVLYNFTILKHLHPRIR